MKFSTPDTLQPYEMIADSSCGVFVLCRPFVDRMADAETSLLFKVDEGSSTFVREFDTEMSGLVCSDKKVHLVDADNTLFSYGDEEWSEQEDEIESPPSQIIVLKSIQDRLFGLTTEGTVHVWNGHGWDEIAVDEGETFFYDIAEGSDHSLYVAGEKGFLARIDGADFQRLAVPTSADLVDLQVLESGKLLSVGRRATAFIGDETEMAQVDPSGHSGHFLNAVVWEGRIIVAATNCVLEISDQSCHIFSDVSADRVAAQGETLWLMNNEISFWNRKNWVAVPLAVELG